jgi:hypothetical protein
VLLEAVNFSGVEDAHPFPLERDEHPGCWGDFLHRPVGLLVQRGKAQVLVQALQRQQVDLRCQAEIFGLEVRQLLRGADIFLADRAVREGDRSSGRLANRVRQIQLLPSLVERGRTQPDDRDQPASPRLLHHQPGDAWIELAPLKDEDRMPAQLPCQAERVIEVGGRMRGEISRRDGDATLECLRTARKPADNEPPTGDQKQCSV